MVTYSRRPHFTFKELQIPVESRLYYKYDKNFSCVVLDAYRSIQYVNQNGNNRIASLTFITKKVKEQKGEESWSMYNFSDEEKSVNALSLWCYDPDNKKHFRETLQTRRFRLEHEKLLLKNENEKQLLKKENEETKQFFVSNDHESNNKKSGNNESNNSEQNQNKSNNNRLRDNEKDAVVKTRLNHGQFRKSLLTRWRNCCSVTGYMEESMLVASHIKPWKESNNQEQIDPFNGLLLAVHLDRAFDRGFISFDDEGKILISETFIDSEEIGITSNMKLRRIFEGNKKYLKYHREHIFKKQ